MQRKHWVVYYKLVGYQDSSYKFPSLEAMHNCIKADKPEDFTYINACYICDGGSEEILATGYKEIMELK